MNLLHRGMGIGAICSVCKEELCVNPRKENVDQSKFSVGTCGICGARSNVCSPEVYDGIHPQLA